MRSLIVLPEVGVCSEPLFDPLGRADVDVARGDLTAQTNNVKGVLKRLLAASGLREANNVSDSNPEGIQELARRSVGDRAVAVVIERATGDS
jgi:hypothetical protein